MDEWEVVSNQRFKPVDRARVTAQGAVYLREKVLCELGYPGAVLVLTARSRLGLKLGLRPVPDGTDGSMSVKRGRRGGAMVNIANGCRALGWRLGEKFEVRVRLQDGVAVLQLDL